MTPRRKSLSLLFATFANAAGCAHTVHQVHVSDFVPEHSTKEGSIINAHREQHTIVGFVDNLAFVDLAVGDLLAKCPTGVISGITTEYITDLGFFTWTHHLYLTGQCLAAQDARDKVHHPVNKAPQKRPPSR